VRATLLVLALVACRPGPAHGPCLATCDHEPLEPVVVEPECPPCPERVVRVAQAQAPLPPVPTRPPGLLEGSPDDTAKMVLYVLELEAFRDQMLRGRR
jgi:hypothetical protein